MTRVLAGKAGKPPGHVHCESVRRDTGSAPPSPQATPVPPHCERVCCDGVRCSGADTSAALASGVGVTDSIMGVRAGFPYTGVTRIKETSSYLEKNTSERNI